MTEVERYGQPNEEGNAHGSALRHVRLYTDEAAGLVLTPEQRAFIKRLSLAHHPRPRAQRRRGGVEFSKTFRQLAVYLEPRDWWIGYYRGTSHHYVCVLPCLVIRWNRR
jgi:hypothetical protein